jgi:hypothetical protein
LSPLKVIVSVGRARARKRFWSTETFVQLCVPGAQAPAWHVSLLVHESPSLHVVPLGWLGFEQAPVDVLQVPAAWHWSVHALPSVHAVPFGAAGFEHVPVAVSHVPAT